MLLADVIRQGTEALAALYPEPEARSMMLLLCEERLRCPPDVSREIWCGCGTANLFNIYWVLPISTDAVSTFRLPCSFPAPKPNSSATRYWQRLRLPPRRREIGNMLLGVSRKPLQVQRGHLPSRSQKRGNMLSRRKVSPQHQVREPLRRSKLLICVPDRDVLRGRWRRRFRARK